MTAFIAITALLTLLALVWLLRPLLRPAPQSGVSSERLNAAIYRDQLRALELDLERGAITPSDYESTRDELQLRLLDDTTEAPPPAAPRMVGFWTSRNTAAIMALLLPLGASGVYWWLGNPGAIDPVATQKANNDKIIQMVEGLAAKLQANPNNPKGWAMLARSYKVMGRWADAEQAFIKAGDLVNNDPDLLVDYADLLAIQAGNTLEGRPLALVNKALSIDPRHPMGLMMSAVAAYRRTEYAVAISQWEKLLTVLEPGSPDAQQIEAEIADARAKAGLPPVASAGVPPTQDTMLPPVDASKAGAMTPDKINQMVERLAERLKSNPDDVAGWARLGRAYRVQGRLAEAEQAFARTGKLLETDADILTQYADVMATRAGNNLEGKPLSLVQKALALNPRHPMALMMAGAAAYRRADYAQAIVHWEKVLTVLDPDSSDASQVMAEIADARARLGQSPANQSQK